MGIPGRDDHKPGRSLTYVVIGMVVGFGFLLLACALIGWHFAVAPVSPALTITAVALGALSATVIVVAVVAYALTTRQKR
ncbi:MAG: hypothetical protein ACYC5O_06130 [Anaerolineae bacterium]